MTIIDGKLLAENLRHKIANEVRQFSRPPGLAVILVGDDSASQAYVRNKLKLAWRLVFILTRFTSQQTLPRKSYFLRSAD